MPATSGGPGRGLERERGATSLELALLTPILLLVILLVVQFAMVYHARHVVQAAAQAGARVARGQDTGDWQGAAESRAEAYAQQIGANIVTGVGATASGDADQRFIDVDGTAITVIPFMSLRVHQRAGGPTECFRPDRGDGVTCEPQQ
jgi:Flp pilus assembly protein TadG